MRFTLYVLAAYIAMLLPLMAGIAELVFGIITCAGKARSVKVLGIGFIIQSIASVLNALLSLSSRLVSARLFATYSVGTHYLSIACGTAGLLCLCIFLHKNYGAKLIYIPVFAVHIGGMLISNAVAILLVRTVRGSGSQTSVWISLTNTINNFVISAAVAVIIIIVFHKHRLSEKVIPETWLYRVIMLAASLVTTLITCFYYLTLLNRKSMLYRSLNNSQTTYSLLVAIFSLVSLVFPVYVGIKSLSAKKQDQGTAEQE